jgi:DNA-binding NarL/FixJ family response regulator
MEKSDPQGLSTQRRAIGLLLVDDHPLIRQGIIALIEDEPDMEMVAEAANGREAIEQFRIHRPDVTLMDLQMPELGGVDAIIGIRSEFPQAAIIVLTTYTFDVQILRAVKAGARAYLLKNLLHEELLDSIRAVHAGKRLLSPELSFRVAEHAGQDAPTPAELAVLRLIADGGSNKQIARRLGVTEETVKNRVKSILEKLGADDRTQAAMIALRRGIIEL